MPRTKQPDYFVATSSGIIQVDGRSEVYQRGKTIVHRDSALYRAIPNRFRPVERPAIEQATAAPDQRR